MPGGRLEPDETPEDALRREVSEETGWSLTFCRPIGILHYTHTDAAPEGYRYPYPDFLQIVYAGSAGEYRPELKEVDGYEIGSEFVLVADAQRLPLDAGQQVFLDTALRVSSRSRGTRGRDQRDDIGISQGPLHLCPVRWTSWHTGARRQRDAGRNPTAGPC